MVSFRVHLLLPSHHPGGSHTLVVMCRPPPPHHEHLKLLIDGKAPFKCYIICYSTYPLFQSCLILPGGNGRRKMSAIPLEAEGYTGAMLRNVSGSGKCTLYIVPLQDELDPPPLPANAPEFALMPKTSCKHCFAEMPLQMLALHDRKCASHTSPDLEMISDDDDNNVQFPEVLQTPVPVQRTGEDHYPQLVEKRMSGVLYVAYSSPSCISRNMPAIVAKELKTQPHLRGNSILRWMVSHVRKIRSCDSNQKWIPARPLSSVCLKIICSKEV
ncbi:hypothetical protein GJAV_G00076930 [Gymnothorax javanicus]|nr:hypothetical protein GJAV_G00076930 [Gymnothorax javanicus]